MAIGTYAELVQAIQDWMMDRSDLAARAPDFIAMGEGIIAYGSEQVTPLRCREMETVASLVPASGVCALPADYLQYRRVVDTGTPRRNLGYCHAGNGRPLLSRARRRHGGKVHHHRRQPAYFPLTANAVELTYYAKVPALTALATTNWLLTKASRHLSARLAADGGRVHQGCGRDDHAGALLSSLIKGMNDQGMLANYAKAGIMPGRAIA